MTADLVLSSEETRSVPFWRRLLTALGIGL